MRMRLATVMILLAISAQGQTTDPPAELPPPKHRLPFLAEEARKRGYELPQTFGIGLVYYKLQRDIVVNDVRIGRNGATPVSVSQFAKFASNSDVDNINIKADVWVLPFLNLYAIVGKVKNESATEIAVTLGGKQFHTVVPTKIDAPVGGLGITLAGGVKSFFGAADINVAKADLGFDDRFRAVVSSARAGWHGTANSRPLRIWANATYWDTFATAKGTVVDPDGGTLAFEVDQGPVHPNTYGVGFSYSPIPALELSIDFGSDFHGGWYVAIVPVFRF
jgi:hypothetical protein